MLRERTLIHPADFIEPRLPRSANSPATETYGDWSLKDGAVLTLEYEDWIVLPNGKLDTASFGLVCNRRDKSGKIGAILFPFEGTYDNQQDDVSVLLIERSSNPSASTR